MTVKEKLEIVGMVSPTVIFLSFIGVLIDGFVTGGPDNLLNVYTLLMTIFVSLWVLSYVGKVAIERGKEPIIRGTVILFYIVSTGVVLISPAIGLWYKPTFLFVIPMMVILTLYVRSGDE